MKISKVKMVLAAFVVAAVAGLCQSGKLLASTGTLKSSRLVWCDSDDPTCGNYNTNGQKVAKLQPVADPISTPNAPQIAKVPCDSNDPGCSGGYKTNGQQVVGTEIGNGYIMAGDMPTEELPGETQV